MKHFISDSDDESLVIHKKTLQHIESEKHPSMVVTYVDLRVNNVDDRP